MSNNHQNEHSSSPVVEAIVLLIKEKYGLLSIAFNADEIAVERVYRVRRSGEVIMDFAEGEIEAFTTMDNYEEAIDFADWQNFLVQNVRKRNKLISGGFVKYKQCADDKRHALMMKQRRDQAVKAIMLKDKFKYRWHESSSHEIIGNAKASWVADNTNPSNK